MGNLNAHLSWRNTDVAKKIEREIHRSIRNSAREIKDGLVDSAQNRIRERQAVYTSQLLNSFPWTISQEGNRTVIRVWNSSPHAPYQEHGVRGIEGGRGKYQYSDKKPPIEELLPWVESKLSGMTIDATGSRLVPADD